MIASTFSDVKDAAGEMVPAFTCAKPSMAARLRLAIDKKTGCAVSVDPLVGDSMQRISACAEAAAHLESRLQSRCTSAIDPLATFEPT
jgi:hypothetical protein